MKVTLDLDALLADGRITQAEAQRLHGYASRETVSKAFNVLVVVGVLAVVAGALVLVPSAGTAIALGVMLGGAGLAGDALDEAGWGLLRQMLILVGALLTVGGAIAFTEGSNFVWAVAAMGLLALGMRTGSGLLAVLGAVAVMPLLGGGTDYEHASYSLWIERPALGILVFGALAMGAHWLSGNVQSTSKRAPHALAMFSRTSLLLVQLAFWIGSLWGDGRRSGSYDHATVPAGFFAITWATVLLGTGIWAAKENRRWVVNLCAVFGMIHFYTQWFERLSGSAGTVLGAGIVTLGVALQLRRYNQAA